MKHYAYYPCPFGYLKIGYLPEAVVEVSCVPELPDKASNETNCPSPLSDIVNQQILDYFDRKRMDFDFPFILQGTKFQTRVWNELLKIPYGETRNYKEIATAVGNPKASRAAGGAIHNNPLWIVIPCHRVIGSNGSLTGYAGGLAMKETLLKLEQNR